MMLFETIGGQEIPLLPSLDRRGLGVVARATTLGSLGIGTANALHAIARQLGTKMLPVERPRRA
jgi:hypothetical protein